MSTSRLLEFFFVHYPINNYVVFLGSVSNTTEIVADK